MKKLALRSVHRSREAPNKNNSSIFKKTNKVYAIFRRYTCKKLEMKRNMLAIRCKRKCREWFASILLRTKLSGRLAGYITRCMEAHVLSLNSFMFLCTKSVDFSQVAGVCRTKFNRVGAIYLILSIPQRKKCT